MKKIITVFLLLALLLPGCAEDRAAAPAPDPRLGSFTLSFLTIGKGDAFLLTTPENHHYLVDTGKDQDYPQIARALRVKDIDSLDGIFLTHGHKDHVGCLRQLLEAFPTKKVWYSGRDPYSYRELDPRQTALNCGAEPAALEGDEILELGGVTARVWLPPVPDPEEENNNSLVLLLTHGSNRFLLMGDAEHPEEAMLMESGLDIRADLLKLGHHGEDDATSPEFLDAVKPSIGLVAGNLEENPDSLDPYIAALLSDRGILCYYSESDGLGLDFVSDGSSIRQETLKDRELPRTLQLSFAEVDRKGQRITIRNDGDTAAQLSGCTLYSLRRDEVFRFPDGTLLEPGKLLTVAGLDADAPGDLTWEQEEVWQKKRDDAMLFDRNMNLLARDRAED